MKNNWTFAIISWVFSLAFLIFFFLHWGFPPDIPGQLLEWLYLAIGLVFLIIPFFSKIKIADIVELERKVEETEKGLHEQQKYANNMFAQLNAHVTTVSSSIQNVHVHLGDSQDKTQPRNIPEDTQKEITSQASYYTDRVAFSFTDEDAKEKILLDKLSWESKSKDLYWLGQNLMYIKAVLLSGGPINQIMFTLKQAYSHMKNLQLDESKSLKIVVSVLVALQNISDGKLDIVTRESMARAIQETIYRIGNLCSAYQEFHTKN